ncbi:hypothetical protein ACRALDRAFT_2040541 [Sodiomyces alcalophilus JCM 7366]|uniref:uncharacterized protein n=1 Tax=Sodiomyces alcalophilus JCM 7366 TaxID=591952 RepID=UPI0039B37687
MQDTDVLIVGAGPTGLALALELSIQNVPFVIVSKDVARSDKSRALVIHSRTLELLHRHGNDVTRELTRDSIVVGGLRLFVNKRHVADVPIHDVKFEDTQFPSSHLVSQAKTEEILERKLQEYGGCVHRGWAVEKIEQDDDGASVLLKRTSPSSSATDGAGEIDDSLRCKYVVGCDGAHSIVRRYASLSLSGATYPGHFILCDARVEGDYSRDKGTLFLGEQFMALFPLKQPGMLRIIGERPFGSDGTAAERDPDLAEIQTMVDTLHPEGKFKVSDPVWLAHFRFHCRGVERQRRGRLFVAGDAAHIHSPVGGQGMNTGIQDAVNLGWKLGKVLRRAETPSREEREQLLDSYHAERHPVGDHLLRGTDRFFSWVTTHNWLLQRIRNIVLHLVVPWAASSRERRARGFRFISQLGIKYRRSPLVGTAAGFDGPVKGGWRAPNGRVVDLDRPGASRNTTEPGFLLEACSPRNNTILLFSGHVESLTIFDMAISDLPKKGARRTENRRYGDVGGKLHERYGLKNGGIAVIRPDLYVEYIGPLGSVDELLVHNT